MIHIKSIVDLIVKSQSLKSSADTLWFHPTAETLCGVALSLYEAERGCIVFV